MKRNIALEAQQTMTRFDVAACLCISVRKVDLMISEGKIPPPYKIGRACRWRVEEFNAWLDQVPRKTVKTIIATKQAAISARLIKT